MPALMVGILFYKIRLRFFRFRRTSEFHVTLTGLSTNYSMEDLTAIADCDRLPKIYSGYKLSFSDALQLSVDQFPSCYNEHC